MTDPMTPDREQEIRARVEAAEDGWHVVPDEDDPYRFEIHGDGPTHIAVFGGDPDDGSASYPTRENAEFAAHARQDIPALLAEIDRLRANRDAAVDAAVRRYRAAWQSARTRANAYGDGILEHVADRDFWKQQAQTAPAPSPDREQGRPTGERRERYAAAIQRRVVPGYVLTSILPEVYQAADAAMAVADVEQAAAVRHALDDAADGLHMDWGGPDHEDGMDEARKQVRARSAAAAAPARERGAADAAALRRLLPKMTELRGRLKSSQDPAASGVSLAMQLVQVLSDATEAGEEW